MGTLSLKPIATLAVLVMLPLVPQVAAQSPPGVAPGAAATPETAPRQARPEAAATPPAFTTKVRPAVRREVPPKPRRLVKSHQAPEQAEVAQAAPATPGQAAVHRPAPRPGEASRGVVSPLSPTTAGGAAGGAAAVVGTTGAGATAGAGGSQSPPQQWSPEEIKTARAYCDNLLRGIVAALEPIDPIKEGECGSPVVYKVSSVGKGPAVELTPPVTLTCDMVAALDKWLRQDVQPQARALLGGVVVRIDTMSSYSCRNAYGRRMARLSEHGKANAIDIASFVTGKDTANVLANWGATARELRAIAAKQEADKAAAAAKAREPATSGHGVAPPTVALPGTTIMPLPGASRSAPAAGLGFAAPPSRLGGPKGQGGGQAAAPHLPPAAPRAGAIDNKQRFLREIHASACKHFGTVLGPEANNAHKNHFHLDMAQRRSANFCE